MNFKIKEAMEILERTPQTLEYFLAGLSDEWLQCNEGKGTWNAAEVIGHLIEGEKNDWIPRLEIILQQGESRPFPPFDRYAHLNKNKNTSIEEQLHTFKKIRKQNLEKLKLLIRNEQQLALTGVHPDFGVVKASELLSTWAVHDLTHIAQIVRVMAKRYKEDVGPWKQYVGILKQ